MCTHLKVENFSFKFTTKFKIQINSNGLITDNHVYFINNYK